MADLKTKVTKVSVASFIDAVPDPVKRADAKTLVKLMQSATGERPKMWGASIIGFGSYHYVYDTGRAGDMPIVGFSPRKTALVLYVHKDFPGADELVGKLGKHSKGCIYVKKLADIDEKVLERLVVKSVAAMRAKYPA